VRTDPTIGLERSCSPGWFEFANFILQQQMFSTSREYPFASLGCPEQIVELPSQVGQRMSENGFSRQAPCSLLAVFCPSPGVEDAGAS
jgi:hypothetical protein